jgi:diaminopimelate decarboxylase
VPRVSDLLDAFTYRDGVLHCEDVPLGALAQAVGTPAYIYSLNAVLARYRALSSALRPRSLVCYSVKANACQAILTALAAEGAGADIVSGGELFRARRAGFSGERIVFAGVGKTSAEIADALAEGVLSVNVESAEELARVASVAQQTGRVAPVAIRVNPDVEADTHRHLTTGTAATKFGVGVPEALAMAERIQRSPALRFVGLHAHIGSQITRLGPFETLARTLRPLVQECAARGMPPDVLDIGGGIGVRYKNETPPPLAAFADAVNRAFTDIPCRLVLEPGRSLVAEAGVILTTLLYRKPERAPQYYVVDAGMTELIRPALYDAYHEIRPVVQSNGRTETVHVVGPVCESSDVLGRERTLPAGAPGDVYAIMTAGAYGFVQASTYNSRPRSPEVLVAGDRFAVVRPRETYEDLVAGETIPSFLPFAATPSG